MADCIGHIFNGRVGRDWRCERCGMAYADRLRELDAMPAPNPKRIAPMVDETARERVEAMIEPFSHMHEATTIKFGNGAIVLGDLRELLRSNGEGIPAISAEEGARLFHETYERLAPQFSYSTRKASAVPWDDVPENNRKLMIATVGEVLAALSGTDRGGE